MASGIGFGLFQAFHRRTGRGIDPYWSTFTLLFVSSIILVVASLLTEDVSLLRTAPWQAYANFGLAGVIHFFGGWTFITLSQRAIGAARTGALIGASPLFGLVVGILFFAEIPSLPVLAGIVCLMAGVYLVSNA